MLNISKHQNTEKLDAWAEKQPGGSRDDTKFVIVRQTITRAKHKHESDLLEETVSAEYDNLAAADELLRTAFFVSSPDEFLSLRYRGVEIARRTGAAAATAKIELRVSHALYAEIKAEAADDLDVSAPHKIERDFNPAVPHKITRDFDITVPKRTYRDVRGSHRGLSSKAALALCIDVHNREYGDAAMLQIEETPGVRVIVAAVANRITPQNIRFVGDFPTPLTRPKTILYSGDTSEAIMEELCAAGRIFALAILPVETESAS